MMFLIDAIGYGIVLGIEANHHKESVAATYWADVLWQTIDIAKAIGEGIGLGIYNTAAFGAQVVKGAENVVLHPLETALIIARGIDTLLSFFIPNFESPRHKVNVYQELNALNERITHVAHYCAQQLSKMSLHDKVKFTAAFAAEIVVRAKIFKVAHCLCKRIRPLVASVLNIVHDEQYMTTPEGILLKCTDEALLLETHPPHCAGQYEALKNSLVVEQFTSIIKTTKHGIQRLIQRRFTSCEKPDIYKNANRWSKSLH